MIFNIKICIYIHKIYDFLIDLVKFDRVTLSYLGS